MAEIVTSTGTGSIWWTTDATSMTSSTTTSAVTWTAWNETYTATTNSAIWQYWEENRTQRVRAEVRAQSAILGQLRQYAAPAARTPETPEQRAARCAAQEAAQREGQRIAQQMQADRAAAQLVRDAARDKARQLLLHHLDDRQRIDLASNGYFDLETISREGERRRYRIRRGRAGNVFRLDEQGHQVKRYCIHPVIDCPDEDTMLTQKLWLEKNEELFLRTANAS